MQRTNESGSGKDESTSGRRRGSRVVMRGPRLSRAAVGVTAFAAAVGVLMVEALGAWAPPVSGIPNAVVTGSRCVEYGRRIQVAGGGFAPGTPVTLSAPEGHYIGPPPPFTRIGDVTVRADASGGFEGALKAPARPSGKSWSWQPRVVFATGTSRVGEGEGQSFDQVLIGTHQVCQILERRHGRPERR